MFANLDGKPRRRERLPELTIPALVLHGRRDPFFPVGNAEALVREIPGARPVAGSHVDQSSSPASRRRAMSSSGESIRNTTLIPTV